MLQRANQVKVVGSPVNPNISPGRLKNPLTTSFQMIFLEY
jgi:hypothetical protein